MSVNPFPGPRPYRAEDRPHFHGRAEVARRLSASLLAHRCVTVFGPSGAGKSSLMQASVLPRLVEEHAFRAVRVDRWPEDEAATEWLADAMFDQLGLGERPAEMDPTDAVLGAAKRAARRSERPLLIYLDQIEQLLYDSRHPSHLDGFADCLDRLVDQPIRGLTLVLSLREDYLGRFRDRLEGRLRLLDHGFRVGPLRVGELAEAMRLVAASGEPPQAWSPEETLGLIMQVRTDGQAPTNMAEAQAAYAQIVCREMWHRRDAEAATGQMSRVDVAVVLDEYLESTLAGLGPLREAASRILEAHLITADGSRTLRTEKELLADLAPDALATVLRSLEAAAILRAEEHQGRRYFELGHDWLAKKVHARVGQRRRDAEMRAQQEQRDSEMRAQQEQRDAEMRAQQEQRDAEMRELTQRHDAEMRARDDKESRRRGRIIIGVAAVTMFVVLPIVVVVGEAGLVSRRINQQLVSDTQAAIAQVGATDWRDNHAPEEKLSALDPLLRRLEQLDAHSRDGVPSGMGYGMYRGGEVRQPAFDAYVNGFQSWCIDEVKRGLEKRLGEATGDRYVEGWSILRTYLLLGDVDHLGYSGERGKEKEIDPVQVQALMDLWTEIVGPRSALSRSDLQDRMRPHVRYYLRAVEEQRAKPVPLDQEIITRARDVLRQVPVRRRYEDMLANELIDEKLDLAGAPERDNLRYPPVTLASLFPDRPQVLAALRSSRQRREGLWQEARAPYTERGHYAVLRRLAAGPALFEAEQWVVPLAEGETVSSLKEETQRFAREYEERYIEEWTRWMADLTVDSPASLGDAIVLHRTLVTPPWPYLQVLRRLEDHTQWPSTGTALQKEESSPGRRWPDGALDPLLRKKEVSPTDLDLLMISGSGHPSKVPGAFKQLVAFGVPVKGGITGITETPLARYITLLDDLRARFQRLEDERPGTNPALVAADLALARKQTEALLEPLDERARKLLGPLLLAPLSIVKPSRAASPRAADPTR